MLLVVTLYHSVVDFRYFSTFQMPRALILQVPLAPTVLVCHTVTVTVIASVARQSLRAWTLVIEIAALRSQCRVKGS